LIHASLTQYPVYTSQWNVISLPTDWLDLQRASLCHKVVDCNAKPCTRFDSFKPVKTYKVAFWIMTPCTFVMISNIWKEYSASIF
jgi:hypothetical protein